ncbi:phosphate uptake regulator PhoU [Halomicrobium salinisoli]|uniref:phosphate uptake regulator PhoU n=1 Tax=Halomicrobium salinisoli TaxID=2878391 RepID=UPI001CF07DDF|nr:phosphate uptake regulator PhoU [Halomicrobium salinisoli]
METRKVQEVGGGTYTVSLPKEWAESEGVAAGSTVDLHAHIDGLLVIQARDREDGPTDPVRVPVCGEDPDWVEQALRAAYAAGTDAVAFESPEGVADEQRRRIEQVARNLAGATVAEASGARIVVRTPLDPSEVSVSQSVRQLSFVALSMHRDATAALTGEGAPEPADRDRQADRLCGLVERHVERALGRLDEVDALGLTRPELFALWGTARELERVADHAERIRATVAAIDEPAGPTLCEDFADLAEAARRVVDDATTAAAGDHDVDAAREALSRRDDVRERARELDRRLLASEADGRYLRVLDRLRRTAEHGGNVAERALRTAVRRGDLAEASGFDPDEAVDAPADSPADAGG